MKISENTLKRIIKEEVKNIMLEDGRNFVNPKTIKVPILDFLEYVKDCVDRYLNDDYMNKFDAIIEKYRSCKKYLLVPNENTGTPMKIKLSDLLNTYVPDMYNEIKNIKCDLKTKTEVFFLINNVTIILSADRFLQRRAHCFFSFELNYALKKLADAKGIDISYYLYKRSFSFDFVG